MTPVASGSSGLAGAATGAASGANLQALTTAALAAKSSLSNQNRRGVGSVMSWLSFETAGAMLLFADESREFTLDAKVGVISPGDIFS